MNKPNDKKVLLRGLGKLLAVFVIAVFSVITFTSVPVEAKPIAKFLYTEFNWDEFYEESKNHWDNNCEKEDEECVKKLLKQQKKFYKKLYGLLAKYERKGVFNPDDEKYPVLDDLILQTVFYDVLPSQMTDDQKEYNEEYRSKNSALYHNDESDFEGESLNLGGDDEEEDYANEEKLRYFEDETDSLKILVKNLVAHTTECYGIYGDLSKKVVDGKEVEYCENGFPKTVPIKGNLIVTHERKCVDKVDGENYLGFWVFFTSKAMHDLEIPFRFPESLGDILFLKRKVEDKYYNSCMDMGDSFPEKTVYLYNKEPKLSLDLYFDFLSNNKYFDNKAHLQNYFRELILEPAGVDCMTDKVCDNSLESSGGYAEYEELAIKVRHRIIRGIISVLKNYGFDVSYSAFEEYDSFDEATKYVARKNFYWPIGSDETEERNGRIYADGEPASTDVISGFGERDNPITGETEFHYGIDIKGEDGVTNVVAVYPGTVVAVVNSCSPDDKECNDGYGNMVILSHANGDYTLYAHMASIDGAITMGASVDKGQLLGKVGQTGATNTPCLHFELRKGGNSQENAVNPLETMDPSNARPNIDLGEFPVHGTPLSRDEFIKFVQDYGTRYNSSNGYFRSVFVPNAGEIYDVATAAGISPELVIIRGIKEGMSPGGSSNNYWGIGCTNGHDEKCESYGSLAEGVRRFASVVDGYDSVYSMQLRYAYIGKFWFKEYKRNDGSTNWGLGGCPYYSSISKYMSEARSAEVGATCAKQACNKDGSGDCLPTNQEDQEAYAAYNASGMTSLRLKIFGY